MVTVADPCLRDWQRLSLGYLNMGKHVCIEVVIVDFHMSSGIPFIVLDYKLIVEVLVFNVNHMIWWKFS